MVLKAKVTEMSGDFLRSSGWSHWSIMVCIHNSWYLLYVEQIPAWISNYINSKVWDEITYPFPNSSGTAIEVWEWISNFMSNCTEYVITYSCRGAARTYFVNSLWAHNRILRIFLSLILILIFQQSGLNFVHVTTAELSWHVQNFDQIWSLILIKQQ